MSQAISHAGAVPLRAALRKELAVREMSQTDLAEHLGIRPQNVSKWFRSDLPSGRHTKALATFLHLTLDEYLALRERSQGSELAELRAEVAALRDQVQTLAAAAKKGRR